MDGSPRKIRKTYRIALAQSRTQCLSFSFVFSFCFQAVPELAKALEQLNEEKFPKLMAYLKNPVSRRVRTNNHVERTNRMIRLLEKVRYKWRGRRTLVRFVVLTLDRHWQERPAVQLQPNEADRSGAKQPGGPESQRKKRRRAA
jgi:hypothetical protein